MKNLFHKLGYHIIWTGFFLIGSLPIRVLYFLSDMLYYFDKYLVGYRRSVVIQNMTRSFPELKYGEIDLLANRFKRYFFSMFAEIIKYVAASKHYMKVHAHINDIDLLRKHIAEGKSIFLVMGHYGNWESMNSVINQLDNYKDHYAIYSQLNNASMDQFFERLRSKFGSQMIEMKHAARVILSRRDQGGMYLFIADQAPLGQSGKYLEFLNQPTRMFEGIEKIARASNGCVLYTEILRSSRGHYNINFTELDPSENYTEAFARHLEQSILNHPEYWLWSHRRWKRKVSPNKE